MPGKGNLKLSVAEPIEAYSFRKVVPGKKKKKEDTGTERASSKRAHEAQGGRKPKRIRTVKGVVEKGTAVHRALEHVDMEAVCESLRVLHFFNKEVSKKKTQDNRTGSRERLWANIKWNELREKNFPKPE